MSETTPMSAPVPPQEVPRQNFIERIFGVFFSPGQTFRDIVRRPDWIGPAVIILLVSVASVIVIAPRIDFDSTYRETMQQNARFKQMPPDVQDKQIRLATGIGKASMWFRPVGAVAWPAILAAIYLLGVKIAGGEASYLMLFAITLYAQMPMVVRKILNDIIALTRHNIRLEAADNLLRSNLSFLVEMKSNPAAWAALASLDVFAIWTIIMMIIGLAATPRMTRGKAAAVVITITLIFLLFGVGAASMSMLMRKA